MSDGGTSAPAITVGAPGPPLWSTGGPAVSKCSPVTHGESYRARSLFPFFHRGEERKGVMRCCGKLLFESRQAKEAEQGVLEVRLGRLSLKSRRSRDDDDDDDDDDDARLFSSLSPSRFYFGPALSIRRTSVFTHLGRSLIPLACHIFTRADRVSHCSLNFRPPQGHCPGVGGGRVRRTHHPHCGNHDQVTRHHAIAAARFTWFLLHKLFLFIF